MSFLIAKMKELMPAKVSRINRLMRRAMGIIDISR
jgi:hypothetical protein